MADIRGPLAQLGFTHSSLDVAGRYSIADLFPNKSQRCGIYVLHFEDGEYYVGQSIDVVKRHAQHVKTYDDISRFSFMPAPKSDLNAREQSVVRTLEGLGEHLRNIQIVEFSFGNTDLEQVVSREDLAWYLKSPDNVFQVGEGTEYVAQRKRYHRRFDKLVERPFFDEFVMVGRGFVQLTIPAPYQTERTFWACTVQDSYPNLIYRINVGGQMTLQVLADVDDGSPIYTFFLPRASAEIAFGDLSQVREDNDLFVAYFDSEPDVIVSQSSLKQGDPDQVLIASNSIGAVVKFLTSDLCLPFRAFHVKLMQKGPCRWAQNHVLDLADLLLEPFDDETDRDNEAPPA